MPTILLKTVQQSLRRGHPGRIVSQSGWCVFEDDAGKEHFVLDDEDRPVPFRYMCVDEATRQRLSSPRGKSIS